MDGFVRVERISFTKEGIIANIIMRNGRVAAMDRVCKGFILPADNNVKAIIASISPQTTFLYVGGLILPLLVIILNEYVAESAEVIKKIPNKTTIKIEITLLKGHSLKTINTAVSGDLTSSFTASMLQSETVVMAMALKTDSQMIVNIVGITTTPTINSLIVLPLDIRATNIPTNGVHAINQA